MRKSKKPSHRKHDDGKVLDRSTDDFGYPVQENRKKSHWQKKRRIKPAHKNWE